ncbi:hypothetical protein LCGC14_1659580 [marine sediment metagenome]|uniref:Uncharacterized protein n=1 Tax=marine sediment metagenome TaxID=412755 RepID=A0A0F9KAD0_9ZZZZ
MGYATVVECDEILGQALTNAWADTPGVQIDLINIGNTRNLNQIPNEIVERYIVLADSAIDGVISQMYYTPLKECASGQWELDADINEYNQFVEISDTGNLIKGEKIVIRDDNTGDEEFHFILSIEDQYSFRTVDPIETVFTASEDTRVIRIKYPPPINNISARLTASYIYDKYFAAQASPNISDYGKAMRDVANGDLNDILNGRTILYCQRRRGDRMGNPWLSDTYHHQNRGYETGGRDKSKPG